MAKINKLNHNHLFTIVLSATTLVLAVLVVTTSNLFATPGNIRGTNSLGKKLCDATGSPVINVTQKITNDADSGQAGNYWAFDTITRQIKVYKQTDATFCAIVDYQGRFDSQAGQTSPGATGTLTGVEDGTFKGGYRATITGTLKANPSWQTKGSVGTTNYQCDLSGNCPGAVSWVNVYFTNGPSDPGFDYQWWGWQYQYQNHTWINSSDGNSGDII